MLPQQTISNFMAIPPTRRQLNRKAVSFQASAANESSVFALCTVSATRVGRHAEFLEVHLWRIVEGHAVEFREFQGDECAENKFWA
jgi:hypothetical protein